jgi:hypothetical protein
MTSKGKIYHQVATMAGPGMGLQGKGLQLMSGILSSMSSCWGSHTLSGWCCLDGHLGGVADTELTRFQQATRSSQLHHKLLVPVHALFLCTYP